MAISTYLSILTLNVNSVNALIRRHMVIKWIKNKTRPICMLPIRDSIQTKRYIHTAWKWKDGKRYSMLIEVWGRGRWGNGTYIRQKGLYYKHKTKKGLHNGKTDQSNKKINKCKYWFMQHWST